MSGLTLKKLQEAFRQMKEEEMKMPEPNLVLYDGNFYTENQWYYQFVQPELDKLKGRQDELS